MVVRSVLARRYPSHNKCSKFSYCSHNKCSRFSYTGRALLRYEVTQDLVTIKNEQLSLRRMAKVNETLRGRWREGNNETSRGQAWRRSENSKKKPITPGRPMSSNFSDPPRSCPARLTTPDKFLRDRCCLFVPRIRGRLVLSSSSSFRTC